MPRLLLFLYFGIGEKSKVSRSSAEMKAHVEDKSAKKILHLPHCLPSFIGYGRW